MANTWASNGADTGGSGGYVPGTQSVQFIHDNFVATGDTITLPTGAFTWSNGVTITKSITIAGSGYTPSSNSGGGSTAGAPTLATTIHWANTIANPRNFWAVNVTVPNAGKWFRFTGIKFDQLTANNNFGYITVSQIKTNSADPFRVDNCIFDAGTSFTGPLLAVGGNGVGSVVDHNTFNSGAASENIHNNGLGSGNVGGWQDDLTPGSNQLVYFEDNYNNATSFSSPAKIIEAGYGSRSGLRYNYLYFSCIDQHGTAGAVGARWWEIYNNTVFTPSGDNQGEAIWCRGGSGFVFNNTAVNNGTGTPTINFFTDDSSTPPPYGPGAGVFTGGSNTSNNQTGSPAYTWGNSAAFNIGSQTPTQVILNTNYFTKSSNPSGSIILYQSNATGQVTNYSYTTYTYPHPLIAQTQGNPPPPGSGLTAAADSSLTNTIVGVTSGAYSPPANNYLAFYSTIFSNFQKSGATEWDTTSNPAYVRVAMGASGAGWTVAAYASGTGVVWSNTQGVVQPAVQSNSQTLFSLGWCDTLAVGTGNIDFFIDIGTTALTVPVGLGVVLAATTGAVFTTY